MYSFGTVLLDLLSGKHIPPSHVSCLSWFYIKLLYLAPGSELLPYSKTANTFNETTNTIKTNTF